MDVSLICKNAEKGLTLECLCQASPKNMSCLLL